MKFVTQYLNKSRLAVMVMTVVFLFVVFYGYRIGKSKADAKNVTNTVNQIKAAMNLFYSDQNRFPTNDEFSDPKVLSLYFTVSPNNIPNNSLCQENFDYNRVSPNVYELNFCLAHSFLAYTKGWNKISMTQ